MKLQTTSKDLFNLTDSFTYKANGDINESRYGDLVIDKFIFSELFWKHFITPITNRIVPSLIDPSVRIRARSDVKLDLQELSTFHYSVFLNLVYAGYCLKSKHISYFENFYTHLGSACDLAEEFIIKLYLIILECGKNESEILKRLSENEFVLFAKEWYDKNYANTYNYYLSKGKTLPIYLIGRSNILKEYFSNRKEWKEYYNVSQEIRQYRNVIVHNIQIASHIAPDGKIFVPRKEKISDYKKWHQVFSVTPHNFKHDFVERDQQMINVFIELKEKLNTLWQIPYNDFEQLLYKNENEILQNKYDLSFI